MREKYLVDEERNSEEQNREGKRCGAREKREREREKRGESSVRGYTKRGSKRLKRRGDEGK